jgi:hypothetical protein
LRLGAYIYPEPMSPAQFHSSFLPSSVPLESSAISIEPLPRIPPRRFLFVREAHPGADIVFQQEKRYLACHHHEL